MFHRKAIPEVRREHLLFCAPAGEAEELQAETPQDGDVFSPSAPSPLHVGGGGGGGANHGRSISISVVPCSDSSAEESPLSSRTPRWRPTKASHTPPPPSRKLLQLLPNIVLTRSKSQESQLANRIEEPAAPRWGGWEGGGG